MTNAKVHEGFRVDKKVEEHWSRPSWSKTASMKGHITVWGNICGSQTEELHCN